MNFKAQSVKQFLLIVGILLALLLLTLNRGLAQETSEKPIYQCPPCGCSADEKLVHGTRQLRYLRHDADQHFKSQ